MGIIYNASKKEKVLAKNNIFIKYGESELYKKGFQSSVYEGSWYGRDNVGGFAYNYFRLSAESELEYITVHISKDDKWIKIFLNIFKLHPSVFSLVELKGLNRRQFGIPPNAISDMQLRSDDYKGPPIFYMLFCPEYKLGSYFTKWGFKRQVKKLGALIEKDMSNIDYFIKRWHELYKPLKTTWEGEIVGLETMAPHERLVLTNLLGQFDNAKKDNKARAEQILEWLKVDKATIKKMVK